VNYCGVDPLPRENLDEELSEHEKELQKEMIARLKSASKNSLKPTQVEVKVELSDQIPVDIQVKAEENDSRDQTTTDESLSRKNPRKKLPKQSYPVRKSKGEKKKSKSKSKSKPSSDTDQNKPKHKSNMKSDDGKVEKWFLNARYQLRKYKKTEDKTSSYVITYEGKNKVKIQFRIRGADRKFKCSGKLVYFHKDGYDQKWDMETGTKRMENYLNYALDNFEGLDRKVNPASAHRRRSDDIAFAVRATIGTGGR